MPTGTFADMDATDLVVEMYDPSGALVTHLDDYDELSAKQLEFGDMELMFSLPLESDSLQTVYSGSTAYARALNGYRFVVKYWGSVFFDGIAVAMDDEDEEDGGMTLDDVPVNVKVECWSWAHWLLSGRLIMGTGRDRYAPSAAKADNVLRAMWRANMVTGTLITPTEYTTPGVSDPVAGTGPFTVSRTNFGPFTVAVEADTTSHPTTVTHRWDHGRGLWENTLEFCRRYNLGITASVSGTTITLGVVYPGTGTDRTSTIRFTREMGNLLRFSRRVDRGLGANVAECRGQGKRGRQHASYAMLKAFYDSVGLRETSEVWRSANLADTATNAEWMIHQLGGATTTYTSKLIEIDTQKWGDFARGDKITIYDSKRGVTVQDYIAELELTHQADDIPELNIITGIPPTNEDKNLGRSGGGGGGGGSRGGGHPKNADGETKDAEDAWWIERCHNNGTTIYADENADIEGILGEAPGPGYVRVYTMGFDPGTAAGGRELTEMVVWGTPKAAIVEGPGAASFYMRGNNGIVYAWNVWAQGAAAAYTFSCGSGV